MGAIIIDGKASAAALRAKIAQEVAGFVERHGRAPGLVGVQVGDDPASEIYQAMKERSAAEAGMASRRITLPSDTTQDQLNAVIDELNADDTVDGMLVQLPVPDQLSEPQIAARIHPDKDVDGFGAVSLGRLMRGEETLVACTPSGVMHVLHEAGVPIAGQHAVVVGRSLIVGKPMSMLLLAEHATVTIAHSRTKDLPELCRSADILVAAVGRADMIRGDWIKPGAAVVDVGINRTDAGLRGDVMQEEAAEVAGWLTPVPGGIGPMTIAFLLANTLQAAKRRVGDTTEESDLKIAIFGGTGDLGRGLAVNFAAAGHEIIVGSRSQERADQAADTLRADLADGNFVPMENVAAAEACEIAIVSIPWEGVEQTIPPMAGALAGKIVISVINALDFGKNGAIAKIDLPGGSMAQRIQQLAPEAKVAMAYNNLPAARLQAREHLNADVLVCGTGKATREAVMELTKAIPGVRALDAGVLANALIIEGSTALIINLNRRYGGEASIAIEGLHDAPERA